MQTNLHICGSQAKCRLICTLAATGCSRVDLAERISRGIVTPQFGLSIGSIWPRKWASASLGFMLKSARPPVPHWPR